MRIYKVSQVKYWVPFIYLCLCIYGTGVAENLKKLVDERWKLSYNKTDKTCKFPQSQFLAGHGFIELKIEGKFL